MMDGSILQATQSPSSFESALSNELCELSQWLCHELSTINIILRIIIIIFISIILNRPTMSR